MSEQKLFTPDEVNRLIPQLTDLMETAIERHGQALALQERLRDDRARVTASGGERRDAMDWKARAERLEAWASRCARSCRTSRPWAGS